MKSSSAYVDMAEQNMADAEQYEYEDAATAIHLMRAQVNATLAVAAATREGLGILRG